jgi:hypothetical protein
MPENPAKTFACPRCGNQFAWKPTLAGKKMSCICGRIFDVALDGGATRGEVYDTIVTKAGASKAVEDRAALYPKRSVAITPRNETEEEAFSLLKDRIIPIVLIVLGMLGRLGLTIFVSSRTHHTTAAAAMMVFDLVSWIAVTFLGGYFAAALLAVNFGHLGTAALKLTAIAIFTGAVAGWVPYVDYDPLRIRGMIMALQSAVLIYFALFYAIFELDLQESLLTTLIVGGIQGLVMVGMHAAS